MSIEENLILVSYDQKLFSLHKFLNWKWIADHSKKICQLFKVKTPTIKEQAINLSGGNQQKFVVGRELDRTPKLLVAVHPSEVWILAQPSISSLKSWNRETEAQRCLWFLRNWMS